MSGLGSEGTSSGGVIAGFVSFTEITDPAEHDAYNVWHLFDHLPEQIPLPGIVWGQRWVASPRCRATWAPVAADLAPVHYLTLYLMTGPLEPVLARFQERAVELRAVGRFHEHRRALLAGPFAFLGAAASGPALVGPEVVPYRPNRGVHVRLVGQAAEGTEAEVADRVAVPVHTPGVAGTWAFAAPRDGGELQLTVSWLDQEPVAVAPALTGAGTEPKGEVLLDGVWEAIDPWGPYDWFGQVSS